MILEGLYFLAAVNFYVMHQFKSIFMNSQFGIKKEELGIFLSVVQGMSFFTSLMVGLIRTNPKYTILVTFLVSNILFNSFFFVSRPYFYVLFTLYTCFLSLTMPIIDKIAIDVLNSKASNENRSEEKGEKATVKNENIPEIEENDNKDTPEKTQNDTKPGKDNTIPVEDYRTDNNDIPLEKLLDSDIKAGGYGSKKMWSTIGYLFTTFMVESLCVSKGEEKDFYRSIYYSWITTGLIVLYIYFFIDNKTSSTENYNKNREENTTEGRRNEQRRNEGILNRLFGSRFGYFILIIMLMGIVRSMLTTYLSLFYSKKLKFTSSGSRYRVFNLFYKNKQSSTVLAGTVAEIVVFLNSEKIIKRFGLMLPFMMGQIVQLVRCASYYYIANVIERGKSSKLVENYGFEMCFLIEILKGVGFGLSQMCGVIIASKLAPEKTLGQLLYTSTYVALGTVISGVLVSFLRNGYTSIFRFNTIMSILIIGLIGRYYKCFRFRNVGENTAREMNMGVGRDIAA